MGLRGPKPTPTKVLQLRGSRKATQRPLEPQPTPMAPTRPEWLDTPEAQRAWDFLVQELLGMRIVVSIDAIALGRYIQLYLRWLKMETFIKQYGETYPIKGLDGTVVSFRAHPQVYIADSLITHLYRLEHSFGMNPSARARVFATITEQETDQLESFLSSKPKRRA